MTEDQLKQIQSDLGVVITSNQAMRFYDHTRNLLKEVKRLRKQKEILIQSIRDHYASASESDDIDTLDEINRTLWNEVSPFTGVGEL